MSEMHFSEENVATSWKKWKLSVLLFLDATMASKSEKEKYSTFLFIIGEGREIFNTLSWPKVKDEEGEDTDEDEINVDALFQKFEDYCIPKCNLIVERRNFFTRSQQIGESIETYVTELKNLVW